MATRNGTVVLLEDFMEEALTKAKLEIEKRRGTCDEHTAEIIAYGAVKYSILKTSNDKNVTFIWDDALSFDGDSGPYLQYSIARIFSLEKNCGELDFSDVDLGLLDSFEEVDLVIELSKMYDIVYVATETLSPHHIAKYLLNVTQKFSKFYQTKSVIHAETEKHKKARLYMVKAVKQVIMNCFRILGIEYLEVM